MLENIADLKCLSDSQGRTYREINNAMSHKYKTGLLVELNSGVRLFIIKLTRDCDGTPLYTLGIDATNYAGHYSQDGFKVV